MDKDELLKELINLKVLKTQRIIRAFEEVDRAEFVPSEQTSCSYANYPLPIGKGQTISQPLTVAIMTEALDPKGKILEVGAGSGYQAAILSKLCDEVITLEIIPEIFDFAKRNLKDYRNVKVVNTDGSKGYGETLFDRIIVTASAPKVPEPLLKQLKKNGKMVIPVGDEMFLIENNKKKLLGYFSFVPLRGEHGN